MTDRDETTEANEKANRDFNQDSAVPAKKPEDGKTVTEINEAADAKFNSDHQEAGLGNQVGGLRGPSD